MNLEHICYGCFQEKPDDSPVCPHCGFNAEEEQPFLALPMGALLNGRYMTGKVAPLPELMDRKKRDIMERKGDKEDENKRQKQQKESSAAAL